MDSLIGLFFLFFSSISMLLQVYEISAMWILSTSFVGFRFLFHSVLADLILMFLYGVWQGIVVIFKTEITSPRHRIVVNTITNTAWWASSYLSLLVSLTRFACVRWPIHFQSWKFNACHAACMIIWIASMVQSLSVNFIPGFERLHYSPGHLGQTANWTAYVESFTRVYYMTFNFGTIGLTLIIYAYVAYRCRKQLHKFFYPLSDKSIHSRVIHLQRFGSQFRTSKESQQLSVEYRLIMPSAISTILAIFGQLLIVFDIFPRQWQEAASNFTFMIMILFNSVPRLMFSRSLRRAMLSLLLRRNIAVQPKEGIMVTTHPTVGSQQNPRFH